MLIERFRSEVWERECDESDGALVQAGKGVEYCGGEKVNSGSPNAINDVINFLQHNS